MDYEGSQKIVAGDPVSSGTRLVRTERLVLRAPDAKDVADIFRIVGDPRNVVHLPAGQHADLAGADGQLATWLGFGGVFWRKVDDWPETLHIGFCFDASAWGRGLCFRAGAGRCGRCESG